MENYDVVECADGRAGLKAARARRPDLILCDVTMPKLDGHGVLRALQAEPALATVPFIFLTAKGERGDIRSGMELGADDYLPKPVTGSELLRAIRTRLARAATQAPRAFAPDFSSALPLQWLGLTARESEVLLWIAQGKSNAEIAGILTIAVSTVKQHLQQVFAKLGVETRNGATLRALEVLSGARSSAGGLSRPG
jgi:DNA-binding NarL/FixJ family response regulator